MNSIFKEIKLKNFDKLNQNIETEALVIGAGMAGLLTAYELKEKGVESIVIDSKMICSGQTQNTTAKITSQHSDIYGKIEKYYSQEFSKMYAAENEKAIKDYERIINEKNIDCDFEKTDAVLYSKSNYSKIKSEMLSSRNAGIDCFITKELPLPFDTAGALVFKNQAQFNPLKFISKIIEDLTIYENTPAIKIEGNSVLTPKGIIRAKSIVVATHYPFVNFPSEYFLKMSQERSYVIAFKNEEFCKDKMFMGIEQNSLSIRKYNDYILLGGGAHRTGESKGNPYEELKEKAKLLFNNQKTEYQWSAQDCITLDNIPYIGKFDKNSENIYVATGFNKWGMTSSMVSANIITEMICGIKNPNNEVFSPQRFNLKASIKNISENIGETVKGFSSHLLPTCSSADEIKKGEAREIVYNSKEAGAYRDNDGKLYIVSLTCPHLKCKLKWNPTQKSWDCPCHGSRYDYKGNLLDNPAQKESICLAKP